jgi:hypothetical protein
MATKQLHRKGCQPCNNVGDVKAKTDIIQAFKKIIE